MQCVGHLIFKIAILWQSSKFQDHVQTPDFLNSSVLQKLLKKLHPATALYLASNPSIIQNTYHVIYKLHSKLTNQFSIHPNRENNINLAFKTIEHKVSRYVYHPKLTPLTSNCLEERGRRRHHRGEEGRGEWVTRNPSDLHWSPSRLAKCLQTTGT